MCDEMLPESRTRYQFQMMFRRADARNTVIGAVFDVVMTHTT